MLSLDTKNTEKIRKQKIQNDYLIILVLNQILLLNQILYI